MDDNNIKGSESPKAICILLLVLQISSDQNDYNSRCVYAN